MDIQIKSADGKFAAWEISAREAGGAPEEPRRGRSHLLAPQGRLLCGRKIVGEPSFLSQAEPVHRICHNCLRVIMRPYL